MYYYNGAQRYEQFLQVGWLYRALILLGLAVFQAPLGLWSSWCYTPHPHKKGATDFFHNNFYKHTQIFVIFGTQLCKWILLILVNLLRCVPCTSLTWWHNVDVIEIMQWHCHHAVERRQEFIPPEMWPSNSPDLNPVDYSIWGILQERIYHSQIHDMKKERLLSEWRLLDHTIIAAAAIVQWCTRLNACVRMHGGHFEHKFWASNFLLCFVCLIDTGCPKCDRYKRVQSANIVWNVLLLCLETFTRYASNITNVWQEILTQMTLAFSYEVVHEKLWKSVNMCKSYGEKISGTFLFGHGVKSTVIRCLHRSTCVMDSPDPPCRQVRVGRGHRDNRTMKT